jgi:membrane protease YdiL (CAAX protease family)
MAPWRKTVFLSLAILALYAAIRALVYANLPVVTLEDWFHRDTLMTFPRLICFFLALIVLGWSRSEWTRLRVTPFVSGLILMAIWTFDYSQSTGPRFETWMILIGILTSFIVGLFEETLFRGAFFHGLSQRFSIQATILLSTTAFAVFHIQAQTLAMWVPIFFTGMIFANLRARGATLLELSLIHGAIDAAFFFFPSINPASLYGVGLIFTGALAIFAVATFPWKLRLRGTPEP